MVTFLDLKNAFGSVPHQLVFDMLRAVKVPSRIQDYVQSFYSQLFVSVANQTRETPPIPFCRGVFQGDTLSPIIFLLAFNPLLKLAADLNQGHGSSIEIPLQGSEELPTLDSSVYVKWTEEGEEPPGWYRARVDEYFGDCSCRIIYDDSLEVTVAEIVNFVSVEWLPFSQRAKKFVPLAYTPSTLKSKWKPSLKHYRSLEHSIKAYADDATFISDCLETHTRVLQTIDQRAKDLDRSFKPVKCVSHLFDGRHHMQQGIQLSGGSTRLITGGGTMFLEKFLEVSLSATKKHCEKRGI